MARATRRTGCAHRANRIRRSAVVPRPGASGQAWLCADRRQRGGCLREICTRLEGIPLAIELAAARVRVLTAAQITSGLQDRLRLLAGGARTAPPRQQTLHASIGWSYELLLPPEQQVLQRLSVCTGGFTLEAAEWVGSDADIDAPQILGLVSQLAGKSLILAGGEGTDGRFRMLKSIREYSALRLADSGAADRTPAPAFRVLPRLRPPPGRTNGTTLTGSGSDPTMPISGRRSSGRPSTTMSGCSNWPRRWSLTGRLAPGWLRHASGCRQPSVRAKRPARRRRPGRSAA